MNDDIIFRFEALAQDADGTVTPFVLRVARPRFDRPRGPPPDRLPVAPRRRGIEFSGVDEAHAARWRSTLSCATSGRHRYPHP